MTLEETITNEENLANASSWGSGNIEQEQYHRQVAEWLRELKVYKDARVGCKYCKHKFREPHERPCSLCQRNFVDMFEREGNADDT